MYPAFSMKNTPDCRKRDTITPSQFRLAFSGVQQSSDLANISFRQLGSLVLLAFCLPVFFISVCHVVVESPEKQMIGIYTVGNVTSMKDRHAFWDGSKMNFPRNAVCCECRGTATAFTESSVSAIVFRARPQPASLCLLYVSPEPHRVVCRLRRMKTLPRAVFSLAANNIGVLDRKRSAACFAYTAYQRRTIKIMAQSTAKAGFVFPVRMHHESCAAVMACNFHFVHFTLLQGKEKDTGVNSNVRVRVCQADARTHNEESVT